MRGESGKGTVPVAHVLVAMAAGAIVGVLLGQGSGDFTAAALGTLDLLGSVFIGLLKMLVVPLVVAAIVTGVSRADSAGELGRLAGKSLILFVATTLVAILIALMSVVLVRPGYVDGAPAGAVLALQDLAGVAAAVQQNASNGLAGIVKSAVPENVFEAAARTNLLAVIVFSLLLGYCLMQVEEEKRRPVLQFWGGLFETMMVMTHLVMRIAPVGVFALTARVTAKSGVEAATPLLAFLLCVVGGLALYALVALPLLLKVAGRLQVWRFYRAIAPALVTAFSTASSAASLSTSLECASQRAGISMRVTNFVMPLGVSLNHPGTALYETAAVLFIAQASGVHLSLGAVLVLSALALITSMGIAGVPASAIVGISIILGALGLPAEAVGVLFIVDRMLDMCRTTVNVLADLACTALVARFEGEELRGIADAGN